MLKLCIMTEEELAHIFGDLDAYIPLHEGNSSKLAVVSTCSKTCVPNSFLLTFYRITDEIDRRNWA